MKDVYEQGYYAKSINYSEPPPPPAFSEQELEWMKPNLRKICGD
jgi:hypothetical protein